MVQKLKVALLGAAGGIGQPLALLLKQNEVITELALYDIVTAVNGVAADLSHIDTPSEIFSYTKENDGLKKTLENADIVVIPAGVPRKPGMTRDDLFKINAGIVKDLATGIAENCPKAFVAVISNPVNSTVPIVAEVLKKKGVFDEKRIFGVTTLDVVRASTFTASAFSKPLESHTISIPVIGGHSGATIIPVLSQTKPKIGDFKTIDVAALVNRIQFGGDEVVKAKDGAGSATLSMAYAGYRFVKSLISSAYGGSPVVENTFIYVKNHSEVHKALGEEIDYFSVPVKLGPNGAEQVLPIGELDASEKELLKTALPELKASIVKGAEFTEAKL